MGRCGVAGARGPSSHFPGAETPCAGKASVSHSQNAVQSPPNNSLHLEIEALAAEAKLQLSGQVGQTSAWWPGRRRLNTPLVGSHDTSMRMMGAGYCPRNLQPQSFTESEGATLAITKRPTSSMQKTTDDPTVDAYLEGAPGVSPFFSGGAINAEDATLDKITRKMLPEDVHVNENHRPPLHGIVRPEPEQMHCVAAGWQKSAPPQHWRIRGSRANIERCTRAADPRSLEGGNCPPRHSGKQK